MFFSLSLSLYIYIYIYMCVFKRDYYTNIYILIHRIDIKLNFVFLSFFFTAKALQIAAERSFCLFLFWLILLKTTRKFLFNFLMHFASCCSLFIFFFIFCFSFIIIVAVIALYIYIFKMKNIN